MKKSTATIMQSVGSMIRYGVRDIRPYRRLAHALARSIKARYYPEWLQVATQWRNEALKRSK